MWNVRFWDVSAFFNSHLLLHLFNTDLDVEGFDVAAFVDGAGGWVGTTPANMRTVDFSPGTGGVRVHPIFVHFSSSASTLRSAASRDTAG